MYLLVNHMLIFLLSSIMIKQIKFSFTYYRCENERVFTTEVYLDVNWIRIRESLCDLCVAKYFALGASIPS